MSKRLCKFDRREIASQMGVIAKLVAAPQYMCRSCARVATDNKSLCKPAPLPKSVAVLPAEKKRVESKRKEEKRAEKKNKKAQKKQEKLTKKLEKLAKKQRKLQDKLSQWRRD